MAKLRKWIAYRSLERPYTRYSKYRKKGFVKSRPGKTIIKYDMGNLKEGVSNFPMKLAIVSNMDLQIRTNAIEAARISILRKVEEKLGKENFYLKIKVVPHHVLRENKLAAGAGADRLSTGMKHSFGKTIGTAARVKKGAHIFELYLKENKELFGREVLKIGASKLPVKATILKF